MEVIRVPEIPSGRTLSVVSRSFDGHDAMLKMRLISSLAGKFDVKGFLSSRYGPPDVIYDEALCWNFLLQDIYCELRLSSDVGFRLEDVSRKERLLVLSHFMDMFVEESKSVWEKRPLDMGRILPYYKR